MTKQKETINYKINEYTERMIAIINSEEKSKARDIAHIYQREGISYEDFNQLLLDNKQRHSYLRMELRELFDTKKFHETKNGK